MTALINIIFIAVAASLTKKKPRPLACGLAFGAVKGFLGILAGGDVINGTILAVLFATLGTAFFHLLVRIGKKPNPADDPSTAYSAAGKKSGGFHWEYIPFTLIALFFLAGEIILASTTIIVS